MIKKSIFLLIARNRKNRIVQYFGKVARFFYRAVENNNDEHSTNGELWLMKQLQKTNPHIIFDVGANVGKWSNEAGEIFPTSSIYAFEPIPDVFNQLQNNVARMSHVKIFNLALTNAKGTLKFNYYPKASFFSSVYIQSIGGNPVSVEVEGWDGDSFCAENNIPKIDFLKLDVEGSEHFVLSGFKGMLKQQKINVVQFEYGSFSIQSKFLLKDYYDLFSDYGYKVGKIYPNHIYFASYSWELENFIGSNFLAVRTADEELIAALT